jgi:hypothetical protein
VSEVPSLANRVRSGPVIRVDYGPNARPCIPGKAAALSETMFGPPAPEAMRQVCRHLQLDPADLRAAPMAPPSQAVVLGARRGEVVWPIAFILHGLDVEAANAALDQLVREAWRPEALG